jgi:hypothetical protein
MKKIDIIEKVVYNPIEIIEQVIREFTEDKPDYHGSLTFEVNFKEGEPKNVNVTYKESYRVG